MNRRRFLVLAAAISSAAGLSEQRCLAASTTFASSRLVRGPRQLLVGTPGRCAGSRRARGAGALLPFPG
jgi:hypothetical protein